MSVTAPNPLDITPYDPPDVAVYADFAPPPRDPYYYLAGPMTGIPQHNFPAFDDAAVRLRALGKTIVSPAELDDPAERLRAIRSPDGNPGVYGDDYNRYLIRDAHIVLNEACVGVICLPDWHESRGAKMETAIAQALGKELLSYWYSKPFNRVILRPIDRDAYLDDVRRGYVG